MERIVDDPRDSATVLWLGLLAFLIAAAAHALVWSGGMFALPLGWLIAAATIGVAHRKGRGGRVLAVRSWIGVAFALLVLVGSLAEFAVLSFRP
jgi:hypothetical protein